MPGGVGGAAGGARGRFVRASVAAGACTVFVAALLLGTVEVATSSADVRALDPLPAAVPIGDLSDLETLSALRTEYVEELLGDQAQELLRDPLKPGSGPGESGRPAAPDRTTPGTTTTTTTTPAGGPQIVPPLPGEVDLTVAMTADRSSVAPGGVITYSMAVTNRGSKSYVGEIELQSHHPFGTTDATCEVQDPDAVCVPAPVPGTPNQNLHTVNHGTAFTATNPLRPGQVYVARFAVRVNETTPAGTRLSNHTHLLVPNDDDPPKRSNDVEVVVT